MSILEVLASVARDCERDIYSGFLHLAKHISPLLLLIYRPQHLIIVHICCLFVFLLLLYNYTWFLHALVLSFLLLLLYIYICVYLLLACWYPRDVLVGPFLLAEVPPPTVSWCKPYMQSFHHVLYIIIINHCNTICIAFLKS